MATTRPSSRIATNAAWARPRPGAADGADGEALEVALERGLDVALAIAVVGEIGRLRQHPIGEIGAARHVVARAEAQAGGLDRGELGVGEEADLVHRAEHQPRPLPRRVEMGARRQPRRRVDHAGEHRRLGQSEMLGIDVEIMAGGGAQAVDIVAEADVGEIAAEDLLLAEPRLQPERDQRLLDLARRRARGREEAGLGELLGDRAAALAHPARADVAPQGAAHAPGIEADMAEEAPVLDRDERLADIRRQPGDVDRRADGRAAPGDRLALGGEDGDARRVDRPERARQGRGDDQPDDGQREQGRGDLDRALDQADARDGRLGIGGGGLGSARWLATLNCPRTGCGRGRPGRRSRRRCYDPSSARLLLVRRLLGDDRRRDGGSAPAA